MPRKRTLFGFARKRIFDTLLLHFTGFTVTSPAPLPSDIVSFRYFGNRNISIQQLPNDGILILKWISGKAGIGKHKAFVECFNRWQVNDEIEKEFFGFAEHQRRQANAKTN